MKVMPSLPGVGTLVDVAAPPRRALAHTLVSITAVLVSHAAQCVVTTPGPGGAPPPAAGVTCSVPHGVMMKLRVRLLLDS